MRKIASIAAMVTIWCCAQGQSVDYELKTIAESPVVFASSDARAAAPGVPRRQFVTIKSEAHKPVTGVILQQSLALGEKTEIVAIEHITIVMAPGEKKRVSFAVADMSARLQSAQRAGEPAGKPILTLVAVEFVDDSQWNAPTGEAHRLE